MTISLDTIRLVTAVDDSPDTSFLGEYTDRASPWAIVRDAGEYLANLGDDYELPRRGREFRFFVPYAGGEKAGTPAYQEYGKSDFERMEGLNRGDWHFVGIYAQAEVSYPLSRDGCRRIERFRSGGLWGIESDGGDHFFQVAEGQLQELKQHLAVFGVDLASFDELAADANEALSV